MSIHVLHAPSFTLPVRRARRPARPVRADGARSVVARPADARPAPGRPTVVRRPVLVRPPARPADRGSRGLTAGTTAQDALRSAPRRTPLQLTRRGRLVFIGLPVLLATAVLLTVVGVFTTAPAAAEQGVRAVPSTPAVQVTVQPGESLWQLAAENAHGRDTRDVVAQIVQLNGLSGDTVDAGRKLYVPLGS